MSPAPDPNTTNEDILLNSALTTLGLNRISSLDSTMNDEQTMDLGSLTMDSMNENSSSEDDEPPTLTADVVHPSIQITTCSAPATPTGERDPPVVFRRTSNFPITTNDMTNSVKINVENNDNEIGLFGTFFTCFKTMFSAMNKFSARVRITRDSTNNDDWEIPIDKITNNELIGVGIEGSVFHGQINGEDVACKRVKTKEETNIKHLKKLNHENVIRFRGISISPPSYYIIMEYCAYGSLYDLLKRRRESGSCTKVRQVFDWSKQIANGVEYLHSNKIVHRDLKSPNILFYDKNTLKISDFGTSKELQNRRSQIMSFNGTTAWMAPEVIRQEPCSEKVDVWSFGIVLWEILTCAIPYANIDPAAVMWGVGKGSLNLSIPSSAPECLKILLKMCWDQRPANRPSFQQIVKHLDIRKTQIILFEQEEQYVELTRIWSAEINEHLSKLPMIDVSSTDQLTNEELIKKRQEELQHIETIRLLYEKRLEQVNSIYVQLKSFMMQLEQREQIIQQKEFNLKLKDKKHLTNPILQARKKSLQIIKVATYNLNDPMHLLPHKKPNNTPLKNENLPIEKSIQQRKKGSDHHHRNNSKRNRTLSKQLNSTEIENEDKQHSSVHIIPNINEEVIPNNQQIDTSTQIHCRLSTISSEIDSKEKLISHEFNRKNIQHSNNSSLPIYQSSNNTVDYSNENNSHTFPRQRRRRNLNQTNENNDKHSRYVTFQLLTSINKNNENNQRKISKRISLTSSEEGETEDIHRNNDVLCDEFYRTKHAQSYGNFSSESEISNERNLRSSSKSDGAFSDEGGQISDDRPQSVINSEPEH